MLKFIFSKTAIVLLFVQRGITSSNNVVKKKNALASFSENLYNFN